MKKFFLILFVFCLTGCFGEVGHGIITKECSKSEVVNGISINTDVTIKSKEGNIQTLYIVESYDSSNLVSIMNSKKSEANMYFNETGINVNIDSNAVYYDIDVLSVSDFVKERFNIKEETHKMLNYYTDNGYTCK